MVDGVCLMARIEHVYELGYIKLKSDVNEATILVILCFSLMNLMGEKFF